MTTPASAMATAGKPPVPDAPPPPSGKRLAVATAVALVVAAIVLVVAVLPAEFGIDPTGTGKALGLLELYDAGVEDAPPAPPTESEGQPARPRTYKTESTTFVLKPSEAFEYKYRLEQGFGMVYAWQTTGPIKFEFHSDPDNSSLKVISHEKSEGDHEAGSLVAPYNGIHGWYWENAGKADVTLTLTSAGFYSQGVELRPKWDPEKRKTRLERTPHELSDVSK